MEEKPIVLTATECLPPLELHAEYDSWDDFFQTVNLYCAETHQPFVKTSSKRVCLHNEKLKVEQRYPEDMQYFYHTLMCTHRGTFYSRGRGERRRKSIKRGCKAKIHASLGKEDHKKIVVTTFNINHNHELGPHLYQHTARRYLSCSGVDQDCKYPGSTRRFGIPGMAEKRPVKVKVIENGALVLTGKKHGLLQMVPNALTPLEEDKLLEWLQELISRGFCPVWSEIVSTAQSILYQRGTTSSFSKDHSLGKMWYMGFVQRHKKVICNMTPETSVFARTSTIARPIFCPPVSRSPAPHQSVNPAIKLEIQPGQATSPLIVDPTEPISDNITGDLSDPSNNVASTYENSLPDSHMAPCSSLTNSKLTPSKANGSKPADERVMPEEVHTSPSNDMSTTPGTADCSSSPATKSSTDKAQSLLSASAKSTSGTVLSLLSPASTSISNNIHRPSPAVTKTSVLRPNRDSNLTSLEALDRLLDLTAKAGLERLVSYRTLHDLGALTDDPEEQHFYTLYSKIRKDLSLLPSNNRLNRNERTGSKSMMTSNSRSLAQQGVQQNGQVASSLLQFSASSLPVSQQSVLQNSQLQNLLALIIKPGNQKETEESAKKKELDEGNKKEEKEKGEAK